MVRASAFECSTYPDTCETPASDRALPISVRGVGTRADRPLHTPVLKYRTVNVCILSLRSIHQFAVHLFKKGPPQCRTPFPYSPGYADVVVVRATHFLLCSPLHLISQINAPVVKSKRSPVLLDIRNTIDIQITPTNEGSDQEQIENAPCSRGDRTHATGMPKVKAIQRPL